jgi:Type II secretion system (T2SS), protein N
MSLAALLVFAAVFCARLPARWLSALLPTYIQCNAPEGSVWNGSCAQLNVRNLDLGATQWQVHAATLLRGALSGTARLQRSDGQLSGRFELRLDGRIDAYELVGDLPLDPVLFPAVPANWRGRLQLNVPRLVAKGEQLQLLQGIVTVRDIVATGTRPESFGSYELSLQDPPDADGRIQGKLRDLDGPFSLDAHLTLERGGIWDIKGQIGTRAGASPSVARQLEILGTPDAAGRRNFALSNRQ